MAFECLHRGSLLEKDRLNMKDKSNDKFTIITVCRNEEKSMRRTIESVLKQTWKSFEYIIIDGASTDGTANIVYEYANRDKRIKWYSEKDDGIYNAMNKGINRAKGEFVYFLNAGDWYYDDNILEKVAEFLDTTKAHLLIGDIVLRYNSKAMRISYEVGEKLRENLKKRIGICHQAIFADRVTLLNGFDEMFTVCADYNWLCQQVNGDKKIAKINAIIANYDTSGFSSQVQNRKLLIRESMEIMKKNFPETNLSNCDEIENLLIEKEKNRSLYELMNRWLVLNQRKISICSYFIDKKIKKIAIYGIHYIGERLYDELKDTQVNVSYAIDQSKDKREWKIPVIQPDENFEYVDAIVITPVFDFVEIKTRLSKKIKCLLISIEEILFYDY